MGGGTSKQQQERQTPLKGVAPGSTPRNARQSPATPATNTAPSPASPGLRADLPLLDEPLDRLSVGELQVFIAEAGLDSSDLREKSELVERARCIGPLEYLKPNSLRRLLEATGQNHAHCLEKGELVDLLRDAIAAGGRGNIALDAHQEEAWEAQRRADAQRRAAACLSQSQSSTTRSQEASAFRTPVASGPSRSSCSPSSSYAPYSSYQEAAAAVRAVINSPPDESDGRGEAQHVYAAALAAERAAAVAATLPPIDGDTIPGQESATYLAAAQMATAAATAAQQQLHMLEARLQMEAERREVERAEKAELEAQLAEARQAIRLSRQEKSVELSETERELLETQQELARLQAELHRSRHSSTTASKAASRSASPPPIHQGDARDAPTSDQLQKIAPGQTADHSKLQAASDAPKMTTPAASKAGPVVTTGQERSEPSRQPRESVQVEDVQSQQPQKENSLKLADDVDATLVVTIMSGADMLPCDSNGLSDPFAVLTLGSQKGVKHKTKVQKRTINPVWDQAFEWQGKTATLCSEPLLIKLYDKDLFGMNDPMGTVEVNLAELANKDGAMAADGLELTVHVKPPPKEKRPCGTLTFNVAWRLPHDSKSAAPAEPHEPPPPPFLGQNDAAVKDTLVRGSGSTLVGGGSSFNLLDQPPPSSAVKLAPLPTTTAISSTPTKAASFPDGQQPELKLPDPQLAGVKKLAPLSTSANAVPDRPAQPPPRAPTPPPPDPLAEMDFKLEAPPPQPQPQPSTTVKPRVPTPPPPPPHLAQFYQDPLADMDFSVPTPRSGVTPESSPVGRRSDTAMVDSVLSPEEEALYAEIDQIDTERSPEKKVEVKPNEPTDEREATPAQAPTQSQVPDSITSSVIASVLHDEGEANGGADDEPGSANKEQEEEVVKVVDQDEIDRQERLARAARLRRRNRRG